ncbi:hypothetical protein CH63R_06059 [Colletotrichum higginsianum IMI 349063]|uniref:Uncharacterized protein n=1 Tax=Colletotrichum higginsianum (strain IMI 349063) TaxID=759273 RepID=A0A1B7YE60_COLHI|nr:hypothetical protein CH63R_06059 [Colletotrichum higginsianum IMI 349063]OBR10367.1 hypothetical protein CH63R_06059 [Colletotrichum higginsianum IMI 349063]
MLPTHLLSPPISTPASCADRPPHPRQRGAVDSSARPRFGVRINGDDGTENRVSAPPRLSALVRIRLLREGTKVWDDHLSVRQGEAVSERQVSRDQAEKK